VIAKLQEDDMGSIDFMFVEQCDDLIFNFNFFKNTLINTQFLYAF
jgi:hypothetical protein